MAAKSKQGARAKKCRVCKVREIKSRGNCETCLRAVRRMIAAQEITESEAIAKGIILPTKKTGRVIGGRPLNNAVRRKLARVS